MLGSVFAGSEESPGKVVESSGKRYKTIRGMGSRAAMEERSGSRGRYFSQKDQHVTEQLTNEQKEKIVPEGVEGLVEYRGTVEKIMSEFLGGIQAGLAHSGANNISFFQVNSSIIYGNNIRKRLPCGCSHSLVLQKASHMIFMLSDNNAHK